MDVKELEHILGGSISQEERRDRLLSLLFIVYVEKKMMPHAHFHFDLSQFLELDLDPALKALIKDAYVYTMNVSNPAMRRQFFEIYHHFSTFSLQELKTLYHKVYAQIVLGEHDYRLITEPRLCELIVANLNLKGHERVLDVNIGQGRFLIALHKRFPNLELYGYDLNNDDRLVARMSFYMENMKVHILGQDFLKSPDLEAYDFIFMNYPWNMQVNSVLDYGNRYIDLHLPKYAPVIKAINALKEKGLAICIVNDDLLDKEDSLELRRTLLQAHLVHHLIRMPKGTWSWTKRGYYIMSFQESDHILLTDAHQSVIKRGRHNELDIQDIQERIDHSIQVTPQEFLDHQCRFDVMYYLYQQRLHLFHPTLLVLQSRILTPPALTKAGHISYLLIRQEAIDHGRINKQACKKGMGNEAEVKAAKLTRGDIVIAFNGQSLKAAVISSAEDVYIAAKGLLVMRLTSPLLLAKYVAIFLNGRQGAIQAKMYENIEDFQISLPAIERQKELIDQYESLLVKREDLERQLAKVDLALFDLENQDKKC